MRLQSLKENGAYLLLYLRQALHKEVNQNEAEVESVRIRIPQLVDYGI